MLRKMRYISPTDTHKGEYNMPKLPDLLTEAKAVVKEWEKDHTVESMDALITAIVFHTAYTKHMKDNV